MTLNVHIGYTPSDESLAYLQHMLHDKIALTWGDIPENAQYDVLVQGRPSEEQLNASDQLKRLIIPFAGLPAITAERMVDYPHITIHNLHHNAPMTAEMALALLFSVAKNIVPAHRDFNQFDWTPRYAPLPSVQLNGKRVLILGYGAIGKYLKPILQSLGMTVKGIRRTQADAEQHIYTTDQLNRFLTETDILIMALPATSQTEAIISKKEIALMPSQAIIINIGRAITLDQWALYDALKSGHLYGAGMDVWYHYPDTVEARTQTPPADAPLHELDNMVMSPHRAGGGGNADVEIMRMDALGTMINQIAQSQPIAHIVDLTQGY